MKGTQADSGEDPHLTTGSGLSVSKNYSWGQLVGQLFSVKCLSQASHSLYLSAYVCSIPNFWLPRGKQFSLPPTAYCKAVITGNKVKEHSD